MKTAAKKVRRAVPKPQPWITIGTFLKSGEGGPGVATTIRQLRRAGVQARGAHSCYVGYVDLEVRGPLTTALKAVRKTGAHRYAYLIHERLA